MPAAKRNLKRVTMTEPKTTDGKLKKSPTAPRRFKSSYMFFSQLAHKRIRKDLEAQGGSKKITTIQVAKLVSKAWKELAPEDRKVYEEMARRDKARYEVEKNTYKGPWKVVATKRAGKDPNAPKRPMSAFLSYSNSKRFQVKRDNPGAGTAEVSRILAQMWRDAPEAERKFHIEKEFMLRTEYKIAIEEWRKNEKHRADSERKEREEIALQTAISNGDLSDSERKPSPELKASPVSVKNVPSEASLESSASVSVHPFPSVAPPLMKAKENDPNPTAINQLPKPSTYQSVNLHSSSDERPLVMGGNTTGSECQYDHDTSHNPPENHYYYWQNPQNFPTVAHYSPLDERSLALKGNCAMSEQHYDPKSSSDPSMDYYYSPNPPTSPIVSTVQPFSLAVGGKKLSYGLAYNNHEQIQDRHDTQQPTSASQDDYATLEPIPYHPPAAYSYDRHYEQERKGHCYHDEYHYQDGHQQYDQQESHYGHSYYHENQQEQAQEQQDCRRHQKQKGDFGDFHPISDHHRNEPDIPRRSNAETRHNRGVLDPHSLKSIFKPYPFTKR